MRVLRWTIFTLVQVLGCFLVSANELAMRWLGLLLLLPASLPLFVLGNRIAREIVDHRTLEVAAILLFFAINTFFGKYILWHRWSKAWRDAAQP
jgi:hypothetical protein